jgi:chorismate-pyruvate lyase
MRATLEAPSPESALHLDHLAPLIFFYGLGSARPQVTFIQPDEMPAEERHLLVHESDMTPRLRAHHRSDIDLDVHAKGKIGDYYVRASVLKRHSDSKAVEFGAIGIHLNLLPEEARKLVIEGKKPFGGILEEQGVEHSSHPRGYFRITIDHRLAELLNANEGETLYGRCNELRHGSGHTLADVVEVLPRSVAS